MKKGGLPLKAIAISIAIITFFAIIMLTISRYGDLILK